jgi:hypothetical protein
MDHFGMSWYENEQKKSKDRQEAQEVSNINRQLQRLLHQMDGKIDQKAYEREANAVNRYLAQSSVWQIGYINNMENPKVALEQALFIVYIALSENFDDSDHIQHEVERYVRQLGNVDWGMVGEYNQRIGHIRAKAQQNQANKESGDVK